MASTESKGTAPTEVAAAPSDPLSNFANLPFSSPDPSAVSLLWNAAQSFLTEKGGDGIILFSPRSDTVSDAPVGSEASAPETASAGPSVPSAAELESAVSTDEVSTRSHEFLMAVSLRIDSLEMAVRYSGMTAVGQQLMLGERNGEESWNVLLPQVMDVVGAVSIACTLCRDNPHKITTSGILHTLLRLIETTITVASPPDFHLHSKLNRGNILNVNSKSMKEEKTIIHCLTPFHAEFLQCCILSQQFRYAQRFLHTHPVHTHSLILSSKNVMASSANHPRFDTMSYLRFHFYSGLIHMKCQDWNSALSSFHLCLTVPCIGSNLSAVSAVSIAARKKMLLIRCLLLEAEELDGPSGKAENHKGKATKSKKNLIENKVLEMPGAASQTMCRYMSNPSKRVSNSNTSGSNPERGSDIGEDRREGYHSMRRKQRQNPSSEGGHNDRGPPLTSSQMKNIRQLGQYHDLVSTYVTGISSHYATLLVEMHDLLVSDENWDLAKLLEGRLAYRAISGVASTYSAIGIDSLEKLVRDICGTPVQETMGSRNRVEDTLSGLAAFDLEDVLVSDPFYARIDQKLGVVSFVEDDTNAIEREEEEKQWLEYDLSKRMESCIGLAERVRDLDIQLSTSTKYQQQTAKWDLKGESSMRQGQGVADVGSSPMDVGADW